MLHGPGIKAHWNLTELIGSTANAFDSVAADVDSDGEIEVIVSKNGQCEFYCLKQNGDILWHTALLSSHTPGYYGGEVKDIDADGNLEFISTADSIWVLDAVTGAEKWKVPDVGGEPDETPWILARVSSTDKWDIVIARTQGSNFVVSAHNWEGKLVWNTAIPDATYGHTLTAQDVDGDGYDEVIVPCSRKTVLIDHDGQILWTAPLAPLAQRTPSEFAQDNFPGTNRITQVTGWWQHSDFAQATDLNHNGKYYILHDYGGGAIVPTIIQVLDALTGEVVDSFTSSGHHQWLKADDLRTDLPGQEIVYTTREKMVMRDSALNVVWERELSGAHELGLGDWDGNGLRDIVVSTVFRGLTRLAGIDSNMVVYDAYSNIIYNMLYSYPNGQGKRAGAQMQNAMKQVADLDGDGHADIPLSFSNHDTGKFNSSQPVHLYLMSLTDTNYHNEFHYWGNESSDIFTNTTIISDALELGNLVPNAEAGKGTGTVVLMHMNEGVGTIVMDSSIYSNNGYLENGEWIAQGKFGNALGFNGQTTILQVPDAPSLSVGQLTIEVWANVSDNNATQSIVERPESFGLQITSDDQLLFYVHDPTVPSWDQPYINAPFTEFNHFVHIVATYDKSLLRLIINGEVAIADNHVGTITPSSGGEYGLYIGNNGSKTMPLNGILDELRISNIIQPQSRQLSGEWISRLIFPIESYVQYGNLEFNHTTNEGDVFYDILDQDNRPLLNHTHITLSPHSLVGITVPIKIRGRLSRGLNEYLSPQIQNIHVTRGNLTISPQQEHQVAANSSISYTHTLTKTGMGNDSISLVASAPAGWSVTVDPTTTLYSNLPIRFQLGVQVPATTNLPLNAIVITATSSFSPVPAVVVDTFKVAYYIYLPTIAKAPQVGRINLENNVVPCHQKALHKGKAN